MLILLTLPWCSSWNACDAVSDGVAGDEGAPDEGNCVRFSKESPEFAWIGRLVV